MSLESIKDKMKLLNAKLTEDEKYQISIDGINERYKAEKEKIELTITDETDKNRKLELLNQQHNLDSCIHSWGCLRCEHCVHGHRLEFGDKRV